MVTESQGERKKMSTPAIIVIGIMAIEIGINAVCDGKKKGDGKFHVSPTIINNVIMGGLLYWGGFFA